MHAAPVVRRRTAGNGSSALSWEAGPFARCGPEPVVQEPQVRECRAGYRERGT